MMQILTFCCSGVKEERELQRTRYIVLQCGYYLAFSTYNWSQFLSISTIEISADFRSMSGDVKFIGKEGTPGGCKSQVPHLIDILLTIFYFNADHLNIVVFIDFYLFSAWRV